jgi:ornithine carbamoyltransferase
MAAHFLSLDTLTPTEFTEFLAVATYLKKRRAQGIPEHALAGKTLAMVFEKPSLRTRLSFEQAMTELGGRSLFIRGEEVGLGKREPIQDVARVLSRYVQGIMARVFKHESVAGLAKHGSVPVINGLCDRFHPCQALGDLLTVQEHFGTTKGLKIVFVGDGNNVARSLAHATVLGGSEFVLACPSGYGWSADDRAKFAKQPVSEVNDPSAAVAGAHVLYTDVWTSMGQEAEQAKRIRDFQGYQINAGLIAQARAEARIMHCLPAHRDEEITDEAVEHARSIIFDQAENRLHAQKAVLRLLMADDREQVVAAATR